MSSATDYDKKTPREAILDLPDTYIGSIDVNAEWRWVYNAETAHMEFREVQMNPGLYKVFDEILVNARDAFVRTADTPVKHIDVVINKVSDQVATISVSNDGTGIPVEIHPVHNTYVPQMIFGELNTSSNYKKGEERVTGGKNGFGAKLTNIYSKRFTVTTNDTKNSKRYVQTWTDNMATCNKPKITKGTAKGEVTLEWEPDLGRFPGGLSDDMYAVFQTRVIEIAGLVGSGVKVTFNGAAVPCNSFEKFIKLFLREGMVGYAYEKAGERWEVGAVLASQLYSGEGEEGEDRTISFVNGINTCKGGKHVDTVVRHVLGDFCEAAKKKRLDLKPAQLRPNVVFFVNATIINPSFSSQTKEEMTTPATKFGSSPKFTNKIVEQLGKLGLYDEAQSIMDAKAAKEAKKTDGKKRSTIIGIPKLRDAVWAGTAKSDDCTLILTEGDSAATSAISGLAVVGRERYGVFPLKGKLQNVKDISIDKFNKNEELTAIKKILGLEHGKNYKETKSLRYGRVMIMADQDHDGSHIKGLVMNLFHTEWPSLLKLGYVCTLLTPIIKAHKGKKITENFYSMSAFKTWYDAESRNGWRIKYYKGLGTSTAEEAREWFVKMNEIKYTWSKLSDDAINLAFSKKRADDRKDWLRDYDAERAPDYDCNEITLDRFVHDELIHFSNADNIRSLPALMDGLKPSQRKILYGCLKRNLREETKVAQLAGYISEHAAYHHGEASLNGTIVGMAQNFVGANNINLLRPVGQFGSRLQGGEDNASPRYIFTNMERIVDTIFKKEDLSILNYLEDDGQRIEPEYYLPVVPLLLINGSRGIGTGFNTLVPSYNPKQIVDLLRRKLRGSLATLAGRQLDPWYCGFKGVIERKDDVTWITRGVWEFSDADSSVTITELPVGTWSERYKEMLTKMFSTEKGSPEADALGLKSFDDLCNDVEVKFVLQFNYDGYIGMKSSPDEFIKTFELESNIKASNMNCFDCDGRIVKYDTVGDIMEAFFERRIDGYVERKEAQIKALEEELVELKAKAKFIQAILDETMVIQRASDEEIVEQMKEHELPALDMPDDVNNIKGYEYLLKMRLDRLKATAVEELEGRVHETELVLEELQATSEQQLWLRDLDEFEAAYDKLVEERELERDDALGAAGGKKKKSGAIKRKGLSKA
jgi:DNA topoisomerase-2